MILPIKIPIKGANVNISPFYNDSFPVLNGCNNTWKIGALIKDTGYSKFGAEIQADKAIHSLFHFRQAPGTEKLLAVVNDATADDNQLFYKTNTGDWTEITGAETAWANEANGNVEMENFIGYCFFAGYNATDGFLPVASLTGTTFSTSTNVTDMPQAKYLVKYRNRLYALNCYYGSAAYPFRVVASSPVTAGAITWATSAGPTSSAGGYLDVGYESEIKGGISIWDKLVVFTDVSAWFYDESSWKEVWAYGCAAHRTIKKTGSYLFFANNNGVHISTGGQPQNISGEVLDFFRNSTPANWFSEIVDDEYHIYVGTVTVDGVTYTNCLLTFNIGLSAWRWRELATDVKSMAKHIINGVETLKFGGTGYVYTKGKYTDSTLVSSDDGTAINANFELPPIHLDDTSKLKRIKELYTVADRAQNVSLQARVIDRNTRALTKFMPIGKIYQYVSSHEVEAEKGVLLQIAGSEYSTNPYFSIYEFALDIDLYANN